MGMEAMHPLIGIDREFLTHMSLQASVMTYSPVTMCFAASCQA